MKSVAYSEAFDDGDALFAAAQERGLEGIISKRTSSAYKVGKRTRDWLKIKTENNEEFVVAGYTRGAGRRERSRPSTRRCGWRKRTATSCCMW